MNYSKNVTNRRNQIAFKRILISWAVFLVIGVVLGFLIGLSVKAISAADAKATVPIHEQVQESEVSEPKAAISETTNAEPKSELVGLSFPQIPQHIALVKNAAVFGGKTDRQITMESCLFTQHQVTLQLKV